MRTDSWDLSRIDLFFNVLKSSSKNCDETFIDVGSLSVDGSFNFEMFFFT
jgi:hypothetical protein